MKAHVLRLSHYASHILLNLIDTGASRPIDEIRRLAKLRIYFAEQMGAYFDAFEDIALDTRIKQEAVSIIPQDEWRQAMNQIAQIENAKLTALNEKYAEDRVVLTFSDGDLAALRKWWGENKSFPSRGVVAEAVLNIDDALKDPEEQDIEASASETTPVKFSQVRKRGRN